MAIAAIREVRPLLWLVRIGPNTASDKVLVVQGTNDSRVKGVQR